MKVVEVHLDGPDGYDVEELVFFDGEVMGNGKPCDSHVGLVKVDRTKNPDGSSNLTLGTELVKVQKGGKDVDPAEVPLDKMTPTLSKMFESVNGQSPDPEKLREFLGAVVTADTTQRGRQPTFDSLFSLILRSGTSLTRDK
jgi:hypothetical protein